MKGTRQFIWTHTKTISALFILGVAINMFSGSHHIAARGVSGLGILLGAALGFDRATVVLVSSVVMLVLALLLLGKKPLFKVLFGSLFFPLIVAVVPETMTTSNRLLSVIFGNAIFALGAAVLYKNNSSSDDTTIPPPIFRKCFHSNTSIGLFFTDASIVSLNLFVLGIEELPCAVLPIAVASIVTTYTEIGINRKKSAMVMSGHYLEDVHLHLSAEVGRGLTLLEAKGGYSRKSRKILLTVVTDHEFSRVKPLAEETDPSAFVIASSIAEAVEREFTYYPIE